MVFRGRVSAEEPSYRVHKAFGGDGLEQVACELPLAQARDEFCFPMGGHDHDRSVADGRILPNASENRLSVAQGHFVIGDDQCGAVGVDGFQHRKKGSRLHLGHGIPSLLQVDAGEGSDVLAVIDDEDVQRILPEAVFSVIGRPVRDLKEPQQAGSLSI